MRYGEEIGGSAALLHLKRTFGRMNVSGVFDWQRAPISAFRAYLECDFRGILPTLKCAKTDASGTGVLKRDTGINFPAGSSRLTLQHIIQWQGCDMSVLAVARARSCSAGVRPS